MSRASAEGRRGIGAAAARRAGRVLCLLLLWPFANAHALDPIDPAATPQARALLDYLVDLPNRADNRVLAGQTLHGDLEAQFQTYVGGYAGATGERPALLQLMLYADWLTERNHPITHRSDAAVFPLSYNHANRGGHVIWLYRPNNPFTGQGNGTLIPAGHTLAEVSTPGTAAYRVWEEDLQMLALQAARLDAAGIPITICMFGDYNTKQERWHAVRSNPGSSWADFRAAWRHGVWTLRQAGVHNVLWCLDEADGPEAYQRRGWRDRWVDIQSITAAHDHETRGPLSLYSAHVASSDKPIIYGQFLLKAALRRNPPSYRYDEAVDLVRNTMPKIAAIVPWSAEEWGEPANLREHSPVFHLNTQAYADDPWMAHRGELDVTFGQGRRAKLPVSREAIGVQGRQFENFDGVDPTWTPGGNGAARATAGGDGILDVFYFGEDPVLKRTGRNMKASFDRLRVRLRNNSLADRIELSWRRTTDGDWSDARRVSIPIRPMGLYLEEYAVDLADHPKWNGTIRQLRLHLNPDHHFGSAELDYVGFDTGGGKAPKTLVNGAFEKSLGVGWTLVDEGAPTAQLARYAADRNGGAYSLLLFLRDDQSDRIEQDVTGVLAANGPGSYRFGARFRLPATVGQRREANTRALLVVKAGGRRTVYRIDGTATRNGWSTVSGQADVEWDGPLERAKLVLRTPGTSEDILIDDAFLDFANRAPVLAAVGDQTIVARQRLTIEVSATDDDGPAPLMLTASPLPENATFTDLGAGSGLFEWTPADEDASATPYEITFTATDDGGAGLANAETIEVMVEESPWPGDLSVAVSDPGAVTHDLSVAGSADWKHFGRDGVGSVNRKLGVPDVIGGYATVGSPSVARYSGDADTRPSLAWSDGTPTASESGTPAGLYFGGNGTGYRLSLPADESPRSARIYLGGFNSRGRLEASLSDGSGPAFSTVVGGPGVYDRVVAIDYRADAGDQTLDLRYVVEDNLGGGNVTLAAVALSAPVPVPYVGDFDDGRDDRWSVPVDDTGSAVNWTVNNGVMRQSVRVAYGASFEESYHVGTYRYLVDGGQLRDYRARVTVTPGEASVIDDMGLMVRYRGPDDYYRLSQSARQGYTRLEKRANGVFSTLGVTAIGYEPGRPTTYEIEANGPELLVSIDGVRVFAVTDTSHPTGSVALYTQDAADFDDLSITPVGTEPRVAIRRPLAGEVIPGNRLEVEVAAFDAPPDSEVVIEVEGYAPRRFDSPPYVLSLSRVPSGEYTVTARLLGPNGGNPLSVQANGEIAVGGGYALAIGDSNTNGLGDTYIADNLLVSRMRAAQGYANTLADRLDTMDPFNHVVYNEGISGDTADGTRYMRLGSVLERHPQAIRALIGLGTNDISGNRDSGELCGAGDDACLDDTIRGDLQVIVDELNEAGIEAWTSTVPPAWPRRGAPDPDSSRMLLTREVNRAIRNGLSGDRDGPDLFAFFYADTDVDGEPDLPRLSLFRDRFHFNGLGHHVVAQLWYNALVGDATGTTIVPFILSEPSVPGYQQNLLDPGDDLRLDNFETVTSFPAALADGIWVVTEQADAANTAQEFLSFEVADRPVDVYVAYDAEATALPGWLAPANGGFGAIGGQVVSSEGRYSLFVRSYAAGEPIVLGGNQATGARNARLMYVPIVVDGSAP